MASPPLQPPSHSHSHPQPLPLPLPSPPPPDNNPVPSPPSSPPASSDHASSQPQPQTQTLPPSDTDNPSASPPISPSRLAVVLRSPDKPSGAPPDSDNAMAGVGAGAVTIGSLLATAELAVAKTAPAAAAAGATNGGGSMTKRTVLARNPWRFRKGEMRKLEVGLRVSGLVLSVTALSLLAADTIPGWAGDSFVRYQEYRYLLSASAIAFLYSAFQFTSEVHQILTGRHFISRPLGYCFNLAMDQIMAYMLVSASSAATSQNYIWISRFGGDNFTKLINASVSMSFLAFFALACSSVISAHYLFNSIS